MWIGSFASNIGTWMQNVVLPAYIYQRTGKASLVALLVFAQLGPLLILAIPGGVIADRFDRRKWLMSMQAVQLVFSAALGRTDTALGVFYRQLSARTGKVKAITATARSVPSSN